MNTRRALIFGTVFLFSGLSLLQAQISIEPVSIFRYPTDQVFYPGQINDSDVLVGSVLTSPGVVESVYGKVNGRVSAPFHEPDDTIGFTSAFGINNNGVICGRYDDGKTGTTKGFIRAAGNFSSYVAPVQGNVTGTTINSINDAKNFVGEYIVNNSTAGAYARIDGVFTPLPVPGDFPEADGVNNLNQIVGVYSTDPISGIYHGYFLDSDSTLTSYDFPGALSTVPGAINDAGIIVGYYYDGHMSHAFLIQLPSTFISYDVPGAQATQFTGINNNGKICGIYTQHGVAHTFIAQVVTE